jgi:hypothetical protein
LWAIAPFVATGILRPAVPEILFVGFVVFSGHSLWRLGVPAPEASWGLLEVDLDVAEMLPVVTLRGANMGPVSIHFNSNVRWDGQAKDYL